ncbi:hypothetical protein I4U23_015183 [Adineta vaga]|nr:hypothetical protein I4U23_015183 [Adineta vaga]
MGCRPSSYITITLDRPNPFYYSGEIVSGVAQIYVNAETLEADEIDMNLIGEIGYTTRHTHTVNGRRKTETKHHTVQFLMSKYVFARPEGGAKELTFAQGQYSWPFQVQLPNHLPPTMGHTQTYPRVRYYLQILIDKAWYKTNTRENQFITVFPRVVLSQMPNCLLPTTFGDNNRQDIIFRGTLNKHGYLPGEIIQGTFDIDNPRQVLIKQINVTMIENYTIGHGTHRYVVYSSIIPELMRRKESKIVQQFTFGIPATTLAPSCQYTGGLHQTASVNIIYALEFDVNVEGIFTDMKISVPIVIGTN